MSILDTFYILFKTNADEAKKGYQQATVGVSAFDASLARTDALVVGAGEHIARVFENVAIRIASVFAIEQVAEFTSRTAELNAQLGITAERLNINVEELAAWEAAAKRSGGSADGFEQTLDFLNRGMADIATKGTSRLKPFFDELKIRVTDGPHQVRPLLDILGDLSDKLSHIDKQQAAGIGEKLGIDPGTLLMLQSGRRAIQDLVEHEKQLGVVTEDDTKKSHAFEQQLDDLGTIFHHLSTSAFSEIYPALVAINEAVTKFIVFLENHKTFVEGFFIGLAGVIGVVYFDAVMDAVGATLLLAAEWLLIPALIAAVALAFAFAYDDVKNFLEGNKSVIGELSKKWPEFGETVRKAAKVATEGWNGFIDSLEKSKKLVVSILDLLAAAWASHQKSVSATQQKMITDQDKLFPGLHLWAEGVKKDLAIVEDALISLAKVLGLDIFQFFFNAIKSIPGAIDNITKHIQNETAVQRGQKTQAQVDAEEKSALEKRIQQKFGTPASSVPAAASPAATVAAMKQGQAQLHVANTTHLAAQTSNSILTNNAPVMKTTTVNIEKVEVQTAATDTDGISKGISDTLTDHIRKAVDQHDDGVAQ